LGGGKVGLERKIGVKAGLWMGMGGNATGLGKGNMRFCWEIRIITHYKRKGEFLEIIGWGFGKTNARRIATDEWR
jgi:hypothetical protein